MKFKMKNPPSLHTEKVSVQLIDDSFWQVSLLIIVHIHSQGLYFGGEICINTDQRNAFLLRLAIVITDRNEDSPEVHTIR
jgi:hypothetical protein